MALLHLLNALDDGPGNVQGDHRGNKAQQYAQQVTCACDAQQCAHPQNCGIDRHAHDEGTCVRKHAALLLQFPQALQQEKIPHELRQDVQGVCVDGQIEIEIRCV